MASVLVVLASAVVLSACISPSQGFDMPKFYLEEKVPGESFTFHCSTQEQQWLLAFYKSSKQNNMNIIHVFREESNEKQHPTYDDRYKNRVNFTGPLTNLSIIITNLTEEDSGVYFCLYFALDEKIKIMGNEVVALVVKRPVCQESSSFTTNAGPTASLNSNTNFILVLFSTITTVMVVLMFPIMLVFAVLPKIKTLRKWQVAQNRGNDSVYEVMNATP